MSTGAGRDYVIRQCKREEIAQSLDLSEYAFQYILPEEERRKRIETDRPEHTWGCFVGGRLAAQLRILPLAVYVNGRRLAMGGIASVATWPEYRRGGMVAALIRNALKVMKEAGQTISLLAPFSFAFYRKYGWETCVDRKKYTIETGHLPKIAARDSLSAEVCGADAALLGPVYEKWASRFNATLSRDPGWWEDRIFGRRKGRIVVFRNQGGEPVGYIQYKVENREFFVHEWVTLNHDAALAMWRFIGNHDSMIDRVVMWAPERDRFPSLADNPRFRQEIEPYFMARIVDVEAFLKLCPLLKKDERPAGLASDEPIRLLLKVRDEHAPWNDGLFRWTIGPDGAGFAEKLADGRPEEAGSHLPRLECDIQTLSSLLVGYHTVRYLRETGRLQGDPAAAEALAAVIPARETWLADFF